MASLLLSWNANGLLNNHINLFRFLQINPNKPIIICIQETHSNSSKFDIPNYNKVALNRSFNKGGGIAIFVRSDIIFKPIKIITDYEIIGIQIFLAQDKSPITFYSIYFPPDCKIHADKLKDIFNLKNSILLGDFNAKNVIWGSEYTDTRGKEIEILLNSCNLVCINDGSPTRIDPNGTESVLELALCSPNLVPKSSFSVIAEKWSDHFPILVNLNLSCVIFNYLQFSRSFKNVNWENFKCNISLNKLESLSNMHSLDQKVIEFSKLVLKSAEDALPLFKFNPKKSYKYTPFWNNDCSVAIKARKEAEHRFFRSKLMADKINLQYVNARTKYILKNAKKNYWEKFCDGLNYSTNLGSVWNAIKYNSNKKNSGNASSTSVLIKNKITYIEDKDKANILANEYNFISSNDNLPYNYIDQRSQTILNFLQKLPYLTFKNNDSKYLNSIFSLKEFNLALTDSNSKSAPGVDKINLEMISQLPFEYKSYLLSLFNEAWVAGSVPASWKISLIHPILKKKKDITDPASYRPIAVTSIIAKIFEKIVANRLNWYLSKNNLINPNQSGFSKHRSCLDNASRLFCEAKKSLNSKSHTIAIFLDLQRAFDLVWIEGLLMKLLTYNINGNMAKFIKNFLTQRSSYVKIGNSYSEPFSPANGIPQGSVLSPILFKIFINDFPSINPSSFTSLFADDSSIWRSGSSILEIGSVLQYDLNKIEDWCRSWGVSINAAKTTAIIFTRKRRVSYPDLCINNESIPYVSSFNFLGYIFDEHLTWKDHIKHIVTKCSKRLNLLRSITGLSWGSNKKTLITVYRGLIRSILDYGSTLYSTASKYLLSQLDTIQYKALSICLGAFKGTALSSLQFECNEPPLHIRRNIATLKYLTKIATVPNYSVISILDHNYKFKIETSMSSYYSTLNDFLSLYDIQLLPSPNCLFHPCNSDTISVDFSLINVGRMRFVLNSDISRTIDSHINFHYKNHLQVYTDASKNAMNQLGISVCIPACDSFSSFRLSDNLSVHHAELLAILKALELSSTFLHSNVLILSDSLCSLQDISNGYSYKFPDILNSLIYLTYNKQISFSFCYIPSHVSHYPHDIADSLASKAAYFGAISLPSNIKFHEVHSLIDDHFYRNWLKGCNLSTTGIQYINIFGPLFQTITYSCKFSRNKEVIINRLRLQSCKFNFYLYKIGLCPSPLCDICQVPDTVNHFLTNCSKHNSLHANLSCATKELKVQSCLVNYLSNINLINIIVNYIISNNISI